MGGGSKKGGGGGSQSRAAIQAAGIQAEAQKEALEYLKETEALPQEYRESALTQLGAIYGLDQPAQTQEELIAGLEDNPLYKAILGTREAGEEAILRGQAQTGGLRSGDTQSNLYQYNQQLQNKALVDTYREQVGGIQSLAGLPSNANQIAALTQGIGTTQAQGITGAAAAQAQAQQQGQSNLLGLIGTGISAYQAFSDPRLKKNIKHIRTEGGVKFYSWNWNELAKEVFGLEGPDEGVLTHEHPECCTEHESGYMMVDYSKIKDKVDNHG